MKPRCDDQFLELALGYLFIVVLEGLRLGPILTFLNWPFVKGFFLCCY